MTLLLGMVTALFAVISLWRSPPELPARFDTAAQIATGLVSGFFGGMAAIWAPPIIVYLTSRRVSTEKFVQTVGVLLFIGKLIL